MDTPVLLIIFNRFDTTQQVLDVLRKVGVSNLFVYSDGPRISWENESKQLKEVQTKIINAIDWPCKVRTLFESENKGPRLAIGKAINWFFEQVEEGVILEHDCVPAPSFFTYCENLLNLYRNEPKVMHISGDNFQFGKVRGNGSYYFSNMNHIWGFATWKRAWKHYDVHMQKWPEYLASGRLRKQVGSNRSAKIWTDIFQRVYEGKLDTWDYQWTFAIWYHEGLAALPNMNLVSNVGFDASALNTTNPNHKLANLPRGEWQGLVQPEKLQADLEADEYAMRHTFHPTLLYYLWSTYIWRSH